MVTAFTPALFTTALPVAAALLVPAASAPGSGVNVLVGSAVSGGTHLLGTKAGLAFVLPGFTPLGLVSVPVPGGTVPGGTWV